MSWLKYLLIRGYKDKYYIFLISVQQQQQKQHTHTYIHTHTQTRAPQSGAIYAIVQGYPIYLTGQRRNKSTLAMLPTGSHD